MGWQAGLTVELAGQTKADRFGDVWSLNVFGIVEIRNCARDPKHAVIAAR